MSASINLCTSDNVKLYLGLTGGAYDDLLDLLIPAASEAIENFCGRRFNEEAYTEYYDGGGYSRLVLTHRPVESVAGIWDDVNRNFTDDHLLDADDYVLDSDRGLIQLLSGSFTDGVRNVKVTYTAGESSVPTDVAQACIMLTAAWFHRGREAADGLEGRTVAEVSQRFAREELPESVQRVLSAHRDHVV